MLLSRVTSGAARYYTKLTPVRWDFFDGPRFETLRDRAAARGHGIYALLLREEIPAALKNCPGQWTPLGEEMEIGLFRLEPQRTDSKAGS